MPKPTRHRSAKSGKFVSAKAAKRIAALEAENARLREVLEKNCVSTQPFGKDGQAGGYYVRFGSRVRKTTGDYTFEGEIVAIFIKRNRATVRYVIEDDRGICLIMNCKQFEVISDAR